jgi:hypothetical protein
VDVREELGYTPWYFELPDADKSAAWSQLMDTNGFYAANGPTTAEQRHAGFRIAYQGHECQWNGPSWPYLTCMTLTGMANVLDDYDQKIVSKADYFKLFKIYTTSQHRQHSDGRVIPWISRTLLLERGSGIPERGKDYNHSTYCDLVISGLIGLRPQAEDRIEVRPLAPPTWDYFCLDQVRYHGHWLTIVWDKTGGHYHKGKGLRIFVDGIQKGAINALDRLTARCPSKKP